MKRIFIFALTLTLFSCGSGRKDNSRDDLSLAERLEGVWEGSSGGCSLKYKFENNIFQETVRCEYYGSQTSRGNYVITGNSIIMSYDQGSCRRNVTKIQAIFDMGDNTIVISNTNKTVMLKKMSGSNLIIEGESSVSKCLNFWDITRTTNSYPRNDDYNYPVDNTNVNANVNYNPWNYQYPNQNGRYQKRAGCFKNTHGQRSCNIRFNNCFKSCNKCNRGNNRCRNRTRYTRCYKSCYAKIYTSSY